MAKLNYDEIKPRKYIVYNDEPYEILESHVARTQQRKPQNQVKMRNLLSGKVIPGTFHAAETADEADISKREAKFLFTNRGEFWFCEPNNPANRFQISADLIGDQAKFLKPNTVIDVKIFEYDDEEKMIGISLPIKMSFVVKDAPPAIKGDTASGGGKMVTIETGAQITTPLFINAGETIVINTETGEYVERLKEK